MIAFGHTAIGASIGLAAYYTIGQTDPVLGLVCASGISFAAHYLEDFIPHGHFFQLKDYKKKIIYVIIFDLALSIGIFLTKAFVDFGLGMKFIYIFTGIFASQLPDAFDGLIYIGLSKRNWFLKLENKFHESVHWHGKGSKILLLGYIDIWQVAIVLISFFFI